MAKYTAPKNNSDPNRCHKPKRKINQSTVFYPDNDCDQFEAENQDECKGGVFTPDLNDGHEHVLAVIQSDSEHPGLVKTGDTVRIAVPIEQPLIKSEDGCAITIDESAVVSQEEFEQCKTTLEEDITALENETKADDLPWPVIQIGDNPPVPVSGQTGNPGGTYADHPGETPYIIVPEPQIDPADAQGAIAWPVYCEGDPLPTYVPTDGNYVVPTYQDFVGSPVINRPCAKVGCESSEIKTMTSQHLNSFPVKPDEALTFTLRNDDCCCDMVFKLDYNFTYSIVRIFNGFGGLIPLVFKGYAGPALGGQKCWTFHQENWTDGTQGETRSFSACDVIRVPPKSEAVINMTPEIQVAPGPAGISPVEFEFCAQSSVCYMGALDCCDSNGA